MEQEFKVGDKVYTGVDVSGCWKRMATGIITQVHSGYYDVDIMSLHGGAPWITQHSFLEHYEEAKAIL